MRVNPVVVCALLCSVLYVSPAEGYSAQQQFLSLSCAGTIYLVSEFLTRTSTSSSLQKIEGNQVNPRGVQVQERAVPLFLIAAWSPMLLQQPQLCVLTTPGQGGGGQAAAGPLLQGAAGATTRVSLSPPSLVTAGLAGLGLCRHGR